MTHPDVLVGAYHDGFDGSRSGSHPNTGQQFVDQLLLWISTFAIAGQRRLSSGRANCRLRAGRWLPAAPVETRSQIASASPAARATLAEPFSTGFKRDAFLVEITLEQVRDKRWRIRLPFGESDSHPRCTASTGVASEGRQPPKSRLTQGSK